MPKPIRAQTEIFVLNGMRTFHTTTRGRRQQMTSVRRE